MLQKQPNIMESALLFEKCGVKFKLIPPMVKYKLNFPMREVKTKLTLPHILTLSMGKGLNIILTLHMGGWVKQKLKQYITER